MCRRRSSVRAQVFGDHGTVQAQGPTRKYNFESFDELKSEMELLLGRNPGYTIQQLDPTEGPISHPQILDPETGYGLLDCPSDLSIGLCLCFMFIIFNYLIISLITHKYAITSK